ncbi:unnamed protein product [Hermetia illucens]|uniref:Uncharacterized protein n=1 Tax=Hermetia illucens TaxID=343691 RepID=A0A7R8UKP2_HERIL|nr:protein PDF [Hermetia illucens]CAD7082399.1 unnamed protein product [Hermetia illucens]
MAKLIVLSAVALLWIGFITGLPAPDEERYLDKEYTRELISWLTALNPSATNPCRFYPSGNIIGPLPKRNSELINSLLSLPKTMNDAGK